MKNLHNLIGHVCKNRPVADHGHDKAILRENPHANEQDTVPGAIADSMRQKLHIFLVTQSAREVTNDGFQLPKNANHVRDGGHVSDKRLAANVHHHPDSKWSAAGKT